MPAIQFILTTAGKNAIVNANNTGTNPVVIDRVALGSASWTPTVTATALQSEIKKISAVGGGAVADNTIHVTASDASADVYTVREVGLYTSGNVLLAIYSQADPIITKGAGTVALIATDLVITGVPAGSVTVGDATFDYPQATETVKGVAELATDAEVQAGTDAERIVTPARLAARYVKKAGDTMTGSLTSPEFVGALTGNASTASKLQTARTISLSGDASGSVNFDGSANVTINVEVASASETVSGVAELATDAEVQAGTDANRIVTPARLAARYVKKSGDTMTGNLTAPSFNGSLNGNASSASILQSARFIAISGDVSGGAFFDGSANITITATVDSASTSQPGKIEIATQVETDDGQDDTRAITPQKLRLTPAASRGWVVFDGVGTVNIINSHGVSSVTDLGVGLYQINWNGVFSGSGYAWVGTARQSTDGTNEHAVVSALASQAKSTSALRIRVTYDSGESQDSPEISVVAFS